MVQKTINREAADTSKGFRLQKIRAIKLMLDSIQSDSDAVFLTAVENTEDVSHLAVENGEEVNYFEEDKNYDASGNFTIFSPAVKNTLVSFFDIFVGQLRSSGKVYLGFYTTRSVGKERKTKLDNGTDISLPVEPILSLISNGDLIKEEVSEIVRKILIEEYTSQYKEKTTIGYLEILTSQKPKEFLKFLTHIRWYFGQDDDVELKETVLKLIENSPLHSVAHIGKEDIIFSALMEKLDEKQNKTNLVEKLVHSSEVKLIFNEAKSEPDQLSMDPVWEHLAEIEAEITDKRNLKEKVLSVVENFPEKNIKHYSRKACRSKSEQSASDKTFLSLKFRIWEACQDYFLSDAYSQPTSKNELELIVSRLSSDCKELIDELKQEYKYRVSNSTVIEGIVLDLFDSCFLAFDECEND